MMPTRKVIWMVLVIGLVSLRTLGQTVPSSYETQKFKHLSEEDGLPHAGVNCIIQDSKGFMWFGTQDGLNRYNGYDFKVYEHIPDNENSLSENYIYSICERSSGDIWIGTNGGGINIFDRGKDQFKHSYGKRTCST